jgi:hypothetical protein
MRSTRPKPAAPQTTAPGTQLPFHRSPVTLEDLLAGLLWPRLLQTWRLALNPGRMMLCFVLLAGVMAADTLYATIADHFHPPPPPGEIHRVAPGPIVDLVLKCHDDLRHMHDVPHTAYQDVYHLFVILPRDLVRDHWPALLTVVPLTVVLWSILGGAVCRSAACEISVRATMPWRATLAFGIRKAPAFIASFAGPLVLIWLITGVCCLFGLLFRTRITAELGALAFGFFLLAGFIFAVLSLGFLVGHFMLIPALACEGTDSFDAVQRTYAYVIARPGRLCIYTIILLFTIILAVALAALMTTTSVHFAFTASGAPATLPGGVTDDPEVAFRPTRILLHLWLAVVLGLFGSYILSLYFCASTTMYLIMRRLVDGQDIGELWMPVPAGEAPGVPPIPAAPATPGPDKADYT